MTTNTPMGKALVIDDIDIVRTRLEQLLGSDYLTRSFRSPEDALVSLRDLNVTEVELVVSDLYHSGEGGSCRTLEEEPGEVLRRIKRLGKLRRALPNARWLIFSLFPNLERDGRFKEDTAVRIREALRESCGVEGIAIVPKFDFYQLLLTARSAR